jgi:hypothetical protein
VSSFETSVQVYLFKRHHIPEDKIFIFNAARISDLICLTGSLIQSVQATDQAEYIHIQHGVASPRTEVEEACVFKAVKMHVIEFQFKMSPLCSLLRPGP